MSNVRTIKFRGICKDTPILENGVTNWLYGGLYYKTDFSVWIQVFMVNIDGIITKPIEVTEKTVGQFIGLKDCDFNQIYEGDIVKLDVTDTKYYNKTYKVVYSEKFAGFFLSGLGSEEESRSSLLDISEYIIKKYKIKVIGNIHESRK